MGLVSPRWLMVFVNNVLDLAELIGFEPVEWDEAEGRRVDESGGRAGFGPSSKRWPRCESARSSGTSGCGLIVGRLLSSLWTFAFSRACCCRTPSRVGKLVERGEERSAEE